MLSQYSTKNQSLIADGIPPNDLSQIPNEYEDGLYDGRIGEECKYPEEWDYFQGWAIGHREHECKKKGIILPDDF